MEELTAQQLLDRYAAGERKFSWVRLTGADLHGVNLRDANFYGASLNNCNLSGADLSQANFGMANLHGANLHGANLTGSFLEGAELGGADIGETALSGPAGVAGAQFCIHCGSGLPAGATFCPRCGKHQSAVTAAPAPQGAAPACPACGLPLASGAISCPRCGRVLTQASSYTYRSAAYAPATTPQAPYAAPIYPSVPYSSSTQARALHPPKSAGLAGFLEFLLAGTGLMYAGSPGLGILVLLGSLVATFFIYSHWVSLLQAAGCTVNVFSYYCPYNLFTYGGVVDAVNAANGFIGQVAIFDTIWLVGRIIWAVAVTNQYNKRR